MKQCNECKEYKPLSEFHKDASCPDGFKRKCRVCQCAAAKRWREQHRDEVNARALAYYHQNKDEVNARWRARYQQNRESHLARKRAWYRRNRDRALAYARTYQQQNRERLLEQYRAYRLRTVEQRRVSRRKYYERNRERHLERSRAHKRLNPEMNRAWVAQRKARLKGNGGNYTAAEWRALCATYDHRCLACGQQEPAIQLTVDHVVPIVHGGTNNIDNIQPLCFPCNRAKGTKTIDYRPQE